MCHKMLQWRQPNAYNFFTSGFDRTVEISGSEQHASVSDRNLLSIQAHNPFSKGGEMS